jgi:hypothetical protein
MTGSRHDQVILEEIDGSLFADFYDIACPLTRQRFHESSATDVVLPPMES